MEVKCILDSGVMGVASVPYGASAGSHEAFVLLDNDKKRFSGKGMLKAVDNVNSRIAPALTGADASNQREIDMKMIKLDGTPNKSNLGANAILGTSLAVARAMAAERKMPLYKYIREAFGLKIGDWRLPNPMMVVIEGGKHADNSTDFQEYLISPIGNTSVKENVRVGIEVYLQLKSVFKKLGLNTNVGNEGAFATSLKSVKIPGIPEGSNEIPLGLISDAVREAG